MASQEGKNFVLYVGDGGGSELFAKVGSLRTTSMVLNGQPVDVTAKDSAGWRELVTGGGIKSMTIAGAGLFKDSVVEETIRAQAFAQSVNNYQIQSGNGNKFTGAFFIASYERSGDHDGAEEFSITLESAGAVAFLVA